MTTQAKPGIVLLLTKLNRPIVIRDLVVRPRLLKLLNYGLEGAMTLVVAPAGFGKTTLVSSWLDMLGASAAPIPAAWLALDENDGDLNTFRRYLIAALRTIFPDACSETLSLLDARQPPPESVLAGTFNNELVGLPSRFIMVLDDLQAPHGHDVFNHLNNWLQHWPRQMHLILLSRYNPPLPLASLRAKGLLTEIRSRDLRFSKAETAEYFRQMLDAAPDDEALSIVHERLEGWVAGLKMASLSLAGRNDPSYLTTTLLDSDTFIADYLIDEVLTLQPPAIQRFLLATSIVDKFCSPLAEALLHGEHTDCDVDAALHYVESADLFITPLDPNHLWYRYHQMFRDLLRERLVATIGAEEVKAMHRRAAGWFATQNLPDRAIHHALEAGNLDLAVDIMQQGLCDVLNREDRPTLDRWLSLLPEEFIRQRPELLVMRAWSHAFRWELDILAQVVDQAITLLDETDGWRHASPDLRGQITILQGHAFYHVHRHDEAVNYSQEGLTLLSDEWRYAHGVAAAYIGMSLYADGRQAEAERFLLTHYESARNKTDGYALRLLLALTVNFIQAGNYDNAERTARAMLRQAIEGGLNVMQSWGNYLLGFVNYEWNEPDTAARYFTQVTDQFYNAQRASARNALIGLARIAQIEGRRADALAIVDQLSRIDLESRGQEQEDTTATRARLGQGSLEGVEQWAEKPGTSADAQSQLPWMEHPILTKARILIARNQSGDADVALRILDELGEWVGRTFNTRMAIEVLALRALALLNRGDIAGARESLIRSVELARYGLFTRVYLDQGPQMQKLMVQIAGHKPTAKTVGRILAAFSGDAPASAFAGTPDKKTDAALSSNGDGDLDEHLTPRELAILSLMIEPISLKAIADRLNISYATARRYTITIYSKFGVHSRWEAVEMAIRKGIISPR